VKGNQKQDKIKTFSEENSRFLKYFDYMSVTNRAFHAVVRDFFKAFDGGDESDWVDRGDLFKYEGNCEDYPVIAIGYALLVSEGNFVIRVDSTEMPNGSLTSNPIIIEKQADSVKIEKRFPNEVWTFREIGDHCIHTVKITEEEGERLGGLARGVYISD